MRPDDEDVGERVAVDAVARVVGVALEHEQRGLVETTRCCDRELGELGLERRVARSAARARPGLRALRSRARERAIDERLGAGDQRDVLRRAAERDVDRLRWASPCARRRSRSSRRARSAACAGTPSSHPRPRPARRAHRLGERDRDVVAAGIEIEHGAGVRQARAHELVGRGASRSRPRARRRCARHRCASTAAGELGVLEPGGDHAVADEHEVPRPALRAERRERLAEVRRAGRAALDQLLSPRRPSRSPGHRRSSR